MKKLLLLIFILASTPVMGCEENEITRLNALWVACGNDVQCEQLLDKIDSLDMKASDEALQSLEGNTKARVNSE